MEYMKRMIDDSSLTDNRLEPEQDASTIDYLQAYR